MLKDQPEIIEPAGHAAKLLDRLGYRSFVPRRYKREVDVGWFDQPDRQLFERGGKLGEFSRDLRRDPQPDKNAHAGVEEFVRILPFRAWERHRW